MLTTWAWETADSQNSTIPGFPRKVANAPTGTRPRARSGWSIANRRAWVLPMECPTTTAGPTPTASANAATSAAKSRVRYPPAGRSATTPNSWAMPKLRAIDFACPMWR